MTSLDGILLWHVLSREATVVAKELQNLRDADFGCGTWDETRVREYWRVESGVL